MSSRRHCARRQTPAVTAWLVRNDAQLVLPMVTIAEIAFGIGKIRPDQRAARLEQGLAAWRHHFADQIFPFAEPAALPYGEIISASLPGGAADHRARWSKTGTLIPIRSGVCRAAGSPIVGAPR